MVAVVMTDPRMPALPSALTSMEPAPVQAINAHEVRPRSTRTLIVDDNQELRELLGGYLNR